MRPGTLLALAGPLVIALASAPAQTPIQPPAPAAPIPTEQSPAATPSRPAYDPDSERTRKAPPEPAAPVAQPAPPPTILKDPTPREAPPGKSRYTPQEIFTAYEPYITGPQANGPDRLGSAYIPVDFWIYPEVLRLYGLGYVDSAFLALRPWTRRSLLHMLQESQAAILGGSSHEAQAILDVLLHELADEQPDGRAPRGLLYGTQSVYTRLQGLGGNPLRDSYHLGQTLINDYGRPYQRGFNAIAGFSTLTEYGPFSLHVRAEYQHAPAASGYTPTLAAYVSSLDQIPYTGFNAVQDTVPAGPIAAENPLRIVDATLSLHLFGHELSGGKSDAWIGPGMGGAMAWSNNAENIYSFRINRVEPLYIPLVSRLLGPIRYDFFMGSLKGHTYPNHPWAHSEVVEFAPTRNLQLGFQRTIIFGGAGHEPVTFHTFLKGFFDPNDTTAAEKYSRDDPGARFSSFNFSYRLPFLRNYLTLYTDSTTHDDILPISAPRRAGYRPGIYLSHFPFAKRLDLRVEATSTDCATLICTSGGGKYIETIQRQGYTNKGFLFGDWIGREAKGGQAWLTWHLSGNEWVQLSYLNKKTPYDFIAGGTTQNQFTLNVVKRLGHDLELDGKVQLERWKAPIYLPGLEENTAATLQITWHPKLRTLPHHP